MTNFPPPADDNGLVLKPEDQPSRHPRRLGGTGGGTIVACNEHPPLLQLFAHILEDEAYDVIACQEGDRVLELIRVAKPDLAILDLRMGGVGARQVVRVLRADAGTASIPVLVSSVDLPEIDVAAGWLRESGCELLPMPFNVDHLLEKVERLTEQHRQ